MLYAVIVLGGLGILFGTVLSLTAVFINKNDERLKQIRDALPGYNCGACGYPGCDGYASALLNGAPVDLCRPGMKKTLNAIKEVLGEK